MDTGDRPGWDAFWGENYLNLSGPGGELSGILMLPGRIAAAFRCGQNAGPSLYPYAFFAISLCLSYALLTPECADSRKS